MFHIINPIYKFNLNNDILLQQPAFPICQCQFGKPASVISDCSCYEYRQALHTENLGSLFHYLCDRETLRTFFLARFA